MDAGDGIENIKNNRKENKTMDEPRYEIIVRNRMNGQEMSHEADLYMICAVKDEDTSVLAGTEGNLTTINAVRLLMAAEKAMKTVVEEDQKIALAYLMKDKFIKETSVTDVPGTL